MARRGKPLPTRRGRVRSETTVTEVTETTGEPAAAVPAEAEVVEETRVTTRTVAPAGGLEMALIVVTLVALIAAFLLLQVEMRKAFGEGWPI